MKKLLAGLSLAVFGSLGLMAPDFAHAGNVGYYGDDCYEADAEAIISAAGHTPVAVATLDAPSLAGLHALFIDGCEFATNAAVDTAVNNGLILIWHDPNWGNLASKNLPGAPGIPYAVYEGDQYKIDFPIGSPVTNGPGGPLDNGSLDGGNSSNHGYVPAGSLPGGSQILATQDNPAYVTTFAYGHGAGRVVFSTIPVTCYFPGGDCAESAVVPGMRAYAINLIAWAVEGGIIIPATTCASEGYTGTKLNWCQNICEKGYTGKTLDMWIRRWMDRYHEMPYCAQEDDEEEEEQQEA